MPQLSCPSCNAELTQAGFTERCPACDGAWVHEDVLIGMLQERTAAMVFLPWQPRQADVQRACPVCTGTMQAVSLGTVALDRCAPHGVWFDSHELALLIKQAKQFKADAAHPPEGAERSEAHEDEQHRRGLLGSLAKLLGG